MAANLKKRYKMAANFGKIRLKMAASLKKVVTRWWEIHRFLFFIQKQTSKG